MHLIVVMHEKRDVQPEYARTAITSPERKFSFGSRIFELGYPSHFAIADSEERFQINRLKAQNPCSCAGSHPSG